MKKSLVYIILSIVFLEISCKKENNNVAFNIKELKYLNQNSVIVYSEVSGTVTPFDIWEKGICFANHSNPTINDSIVKDLPDIGEFKSCISGLNANTTYYIKVFAKTPDGLFYSDQQSFKTSDVEYFTDTRDGQKYPVITIGSQTWFAANLNFKTGENSFYFENDSTKNAKEFGKLYTYDAALEACPAGWHLPSDEEWKQLEMEMGMSQSTADSLTWRGEKAGNNLKEPGSRLWNYDTDNMATNVSGFTIKPGGSYNLITTEFSEPRLTAKFWTSTISGNEVYARLIQVINGKILRGTVNKDNIAYSVRCIKD